ncbi:formylglycine-generating enzyme family protein [Roseibacillus persicicus]|uniref:formylglycine-generating enzyme family protein n=1 Tax=Roseibacillus persicicus TaxID=454148 RepID=UPI00280ED0F2|nr:formylglycine-generating enzyme family protein [Roseibacillus persicicus]MDQ8192017.1 formylglycine-generating enzyme family protein [Roseibacillus persicicus]
MKLPFIALTLALASHSPAQEPTLLSSWTNSLGIKLVPIPAGEFQMGSPPSEEGRGKDEDQVTVTISKPFLMMESEVTQAQWEKIMGTTIQEQIDSKVGPIGRGAKLVAKASALGPSQPMSFVNWADANAFCLKLTKLEKESGTLPPDLSYQLPTEAQWEYACRAGTTTVFHFGNTLSAEQANFYGKKPYGIEKEGLYREKTTPVKSFSANPWGLYDMHGNLYEWCADWYADQASGGLDPRGPDTGDGRIIRGGTWNRVANSCRSAYRYSSGPESRSYNIGFRIILQKS